MGSRSELEKTARKAYEYQRAALYDLVRECQSLLDQHGPDALQQDLPEHQDDQKVLEAAQTLCEADRKYIDAMNQAYPDWTGEPPP